MRNVLEKLWGVALHNVYFGFYMFRKLTELRCFVTYLSNDPRTWSDRWSGYIARFRNLMPSLWAHCTAWYSPWYSIQYSPNNLHCLEFHSQTEHQSLNNVGKFLTHLSASATKRYNLIPMKAGTQIDALAVWAWSCNFHWCLAESKISSI